MKRIYRDKNCQREASSESVHKEGWEVCLCTSVCVRHVHPSAHPVPVLRVCVRVCLRACDFMFVLLVGSAQGFLYLAAVGTLPSSYGLWMRITVTFASGQRQTAPVFPL